MVWLNAPKNIDDVLWEGPLEPTSEVAVEHMRRELSERGLESKVSEYVRYLPIVTIGRPRAWPLEQLYGAEEMPPLLRTERERSDLYLIQLACSFRPVREEIRIEWGRLVARLLPDQREHQPLALDVYPREVLHHVQRNIKVTLGPTLKFKEVEASIGGVEFGCSYEEIQPTISAAGIGECIPMWDFTQHPGLPLHGVRVLYLLVSAPKETSPGSAVLDFVADVRVNESRLSTLLGRNRKEAEAHLSCDFW